MVAISLKSQSEIVITAPFQPSPKASDKWKYRAWQLLQVELE
jgi:hypothetical protein